ncbi:hypothetical protein PDIG_14190 [Penicillium digitatum PHI26]|uniref:Uncharacterized protein n=2 Tax=Penicillium digitatum TaxID=36651 RepID=K9G835_PEND2|nr:hypothetical protein PDIP_32120 [Penicillium digitatum Pd1]EKV17275.1 hypothetical protein PDIP_32120 [Penicillium digitatum Pd1]EKV17539.1 hypothetical protein PDIG_14190 [Penicillium digitatum PHI26]
MNTLLTTLLNTFIVTSVFLGSRKARRKSSCRKLGRTHFGFAGPKKKEVKYAERSKAKI